MRRVSVERATDGSEPWRGSLSDRMLTAKNLSSRMLDQRQLQEHPRLSIVPPFARPDTWTSPSKSHARVRRTFITLAALAQISTPSAAHFLKSHQLLVQSLRRIEIGKDPHSSQAAR
jgi:hypothetical protein